MKLQDFYNKTIKFGRQNDPRKGKAINRYEDTAILNGNLQTEIKKILVGIDIEVPELLLADRIRQRTGLDLVLAHHPEGHAFASLHEVMRLQVDILKEMGVSESVATKLLEERQQEVERRILPNNHMRSVDAAKILDLAFMCAHTPADNHVFSYLTGIFNREKPKTVQDTVDILMSIEEYKQAAKESVGPRVVLGSPKRNVGKILVEMTGGTEGSGRIYEKLYNKDVRTLVCMHVSEDHFKKVADAHLNIVIAGHISSDTLGLNLLLDNLEKSEDFQIYSCSGFRRVKRK